MKIGVKKYNISTVFSRGLYCGPRNSSRKVLLDVFGFCLGYARFFFKNGTIWARTWTYCYELNLYMHWSSHNFITYHNYIHVHFLCYHLPDLVILSRCSDYLGPFVSSDPKSCFECFIENGMGLCLYCRTSLQFLYLLGH